MGWKVSAGVACIATLVLGANAAAAPRCARPDEVTAIQAAMIQQELMVAALTCNEVEHFNAFQTNFGPELRTSDAKLARMFMRLYGARRGEAEYHAFKTRLANHSSMRSIRDNVSYCHEAASVFGSALTTEKPSLTSFVAGVQVVETSPVNSCQVRVQVGLAGAKVAPDVVPDVVPQPNPERIANVSGQ
ncbi:MAG TPA: hypothetical protein VHY79_08175 [Rhizomicrobium sp.]|jgi:hypothetical protein|nr:hypothetical protein [Rhizomicrobium sp.]